jgi:uncharacterized UBP type Zn finger protein
MNAVLQILAAFYKDQIAKEKEENSTPLADTTNDLIKTLTDTCPAMSSTLQGKANGFFDEAMPKSGTGLGFTKGTQQDAAELLNSLLNYFKIPKASSPGKFVNTITEEKKDDNSNTSWNIKQIPISEADNNRSMQALFDASMMTEKISMKWKDADAAAIEVVKTIQLQGIDKLPILPIQLVRMQGYNTTTGTTLKVNSNITNPLELVIKKEHIKWDPKDMQQDLKYELAGCIVHWGSTGNSGHYVAYIKEGGQWRLYDDNNVSELTVSEVEKAAQEAYIFFYQLQNS